MDEEHRGSSGGSTAMMVVAILGGLVIAVFCGGVVVVGVGVLTFRNVEVSAPAARTITLPREVAPETKPSLDDLKQFEPGDGTKEGAVAPPSLTAPSGERLDSSPPSELKAPGIETTPALDKKKE